MPPPPPPGPPPPPVLEIPQTNRKQVDNRSALLSSIRTGAALKKTVTNDRSSPLVDGKRLASNGSGDARVNGAPCNLGGLFAGGMPKLRSTTNRNNLDSSGGPSALFPPNKKFSAPSPPSNTAALPESQASNAARSSTSPNVPEYAMSSKGGGARKPFPNDRKPAPQPPPACNKPTFGGGSNSATLPRRGPPLPNKPPVQTQRPAIGPRPALAAKPTPPTKQTNGPPLPAHPPNLRRPSSLGEHDLQTSKFSRGISAAGSVPKLNIANNQHSAASGGTNPPTRNFASTGSLSQKQMAPPPPPPTNAPAAGGPRMAMPVPPERSISSTRPSGMLPSGPPSIRPPGMHPLFPPNTRPPAPSSKPPSNGFSHPPAPSIAPPPPPHQMHLGGNNIPPPPPHRTNVPHMVGSPNCPPPPPTRHASTRAGSYTSKTADDFESKFIEKFLSIGDLPHPEPFLSCKKTYPKKNESNHVMNGQRRMPPPPPPQGAQGLPPPMQIHIASDLYRRQETQC